MHYYFIYAADLSGLSHQADAGPVFAHVHSSDNRYLFVVGIRGPVKKPAYSISEYPYTCYVYLCRNNEVQARMIASQVQALFDLL